MGTTVFTFQPTGPIEESQEHRTIITSFESGKEVRTRKWTRPKKHYKLSFNSISEATAEQIFDFYTDRDGDFDSFYWNNSNESPTANIVVGTGDGSATAYTIPRFRYPVVPNSEAITLNSSGQTDPTNYSLNDTTGVITFVSAPGNNVVVRISHNFYRIVRFKEPNLSREQFAFNLFNSELEFIEVI